MSGTAARKATQPKPKPVVEATIYTALGLTDQDLSFEGLLATKAEVDASEARTQARYALQFFALKDETDARTKIEKITGIGKGRISVLINAAELLLIPAGVHAAGLGKAAVGVIAEWGQKRVAKALKDEPMTGEALARWIESSYALINTRRVEGKSTKTGEPLVEAEKATPVEKAEAAVAKVTDVDAMTLVLTKVLHRAFEVGVDVDSVLATVRAEVEASLIEAAEAETEKVPA